MNNKSDIRRLFSSAMLAIMLTATFNSASADAASEGKKIAFDRKQGNCLACHAIQGGTQTGSIGPALISMKSRYPNKSLLRKRIWDARVDNPHTIMPPFGKYGILSDEQIDKVVAFIYSL